MFTPKTASSALLLCLLIPCAKAESVVISFSGVVTLSYGVSAIPVGTLYSGQITYDSGDTSFLSTSGVTGYNPSGPSEGITLNVGQYTFSSIGTPNTTMGVGYQSSLGYDFFEVYNANQIPNSGRTDNLPGMPLIGIYFDAMGNAGLLSSSALPLSLDISDLVSRAGAVDSGITIAFDQEANLAGSPALAGNLQSIEIQTIPEPGPALLMCPIALAVFLARRRATR